MSYLAKILTALGRLGTNGTTNPDAPVGSGAKTSMRSKSNMPEEDLAIGEAFLWDEVEHHAKVKSKSAWARITAASRDKTSTLAPGTHELTNTPHFSVLAKISEPRRSLDHDKLIEILAGSKYKVPAHFTREAIDKSKLPDKSSVTLSIIERRS